MRSKTTNVNQEGATAGADIVGGDKIEHNHFPPNKTPSVIEQLLGKLQSEIENSAKARETIEALRHFYERKSHDGVNGLEAKLEKGGRLHEKFLAIEKKEMFVKLLEKWSLYISAQEILVHLLARAEHEFSMIVLPQIGSLKEHELNELIGTRIVNPIVEECGGSIFHMNHGVAMGMLYWLAEQCFVRWHQ